MESYDEFIILDLPKIVKCEVVSMESYYKAKEMKDSNYDYFNIMDLPILLKACMHFQLLSFHIMTIFSSCAKDATNWGFPLLMDI
jgi:hypothetical protein